MYEDKELLLKKQKWEKLLELSNYFYTEYSLCKKISGALLLVSCGIN